MHAEREKESKLRNRTRQSASRRIFSGLRSLCIMCHLYEDEKQQKQFMLRIYVPNPPCLSVESTEFEPILTDMLVRVLI
jgi:hypothetical protein